MFWGAGGVTELGKQEQTLGRLGERGHSQSNEAGPSGWGSGLAKRGGGRGNECSWFARNRRSVNQLRARPELLSGNGVTEGGMEGEAEPSGLKPRSQQEGLGNRPQQLPHPCLPAQALPETLCREEGPGTSWEEEKEDG